MSALRTPSIAALLVACSIVLGACGGDTQAKDTTSSSASEDVAAESLLVIDGKEVGASEVDPGPGDGAANARDPGADQAAEGDDGVDEEEWPAPELLDDGTIDAGPDPFDGESVPVQAMPIEDDPNTTTTIAAEAQRLRRVDLAKWQTWMDNDASSPWQQATTDPASHLVEVTVERCGGARQVASGVVLGDETVVTNVHVVENAAKRVWIAPAVNSEAQRRIPAMIRYLDVDDDVAVLKVPGLQLTPMLWHPVVDPDQPLFGYAFGVGRGGRAGSMRRVPVITSMREQTITVEQPDGFARRISDRPVHTIVGGISSGMSGGIVAATNDPDEISGWGFHGLLRARMGLRADTAGVVVPSRIVGDALDANDRLDEWYEIKPGGCPQWHR